MGDGWGRNDELNLFDGVMVGITILMILASLLSSVLS